MKKNRWFEFAGEDLIVAKAAMRERVFNQACFHAHQGTEKMLKGYLAAQGQDVPRTHFISVLLKLSTAIEPRFKELAEICLKLDDYYIPTRYPDALPGTLSEGLPMEKDAKEALSILESVMGFIRGLK
jgi:HEPN domain-containing protein